jgi:spermidine synthase
MMAAESSHHTRIRFACRRVVALACGLTFAVTLFLSLTAAAQEPQGKLLESRESKYNSIFVYQNGDFISMTFGHNKKVFTESIYNTRDDRDLPVTYTRFMTASVAYPNAPDDILAIGLGGGRTSWYLHKYLPAARITCVELDPDVVALATKYFGIHRESNYKLIVDDGRLFLNDNVRLYDVILIDAYRGPFVPFQLLTRQFYEIVKAHLKSGGVVAQNVEPTTMLFNSAVATIKAVFQNVDLYDADGNIVIVAYDGRPRSQSALMSSAREKQNQFGFKYPLPELIAQRRVLNQVPEAKVLTDDFAPVEALKAIERHNRKLDTFTDAPK